MVYANGFLVTSLLRPCRMDASANSQAVLKILVESLREQWPNVRIIFQADSGFLPLENPQVVRQASCGLYRWACKEQGVDFAKKVLRQ